MNSEDQFKDSLRDLVESKEFPLDEDNWDKAAGLLRPESGSKKYLWLSIAAMLLVSIGIFTYTYVTAPATVVADNTIPSVNESPATKTPVEKTAAVPSEKTNPVMPAVIETASNAPSSSNITSPNAAKLHEGPVSKPNATTGPLHLTEQTKADVFTPQRSKTPALVKANPAAVKEQKEVVAKAKKTRRQKNNTVDPAQTKGIEPLASGKDEATATQPGTPAVTKAPEVPGTDENKTADPVQGKLTEIPSTEPAVTATPTTTDATKEVAAARPDSASAVAPDRNFIKPDKKILFSVEAGTSYLFGWKNPGGTDAQGFNPVMGINYFHYLTEKVAASFGIQYTSVGHMSYASHTSKITRYDLGEQSAVTVITPDKIHYVTVPVKFNYFINSNNAIGVGCNVAYLLTIDSKVETYDQSIHGKQNVKHSTARGYTEGFNTFDTQLSVFYRRRIYKSLSVNAEFIYGLTDTKNNSFFSPDVFERNKGLKLTLLFDIFK